MAIEFGAKQKTIIGIHNKNKNSFSISKKEFVIPDNEDQSIFLLTRDNFFSISTPQIKYLLTSSPKYEKFENIKSIVTNILLIPGALIAVTYILKFSSLLQDYPQITKILNLPIVNILFGISIFSILLLWHDFWGDRNQQINLPKIKNIPQKDLDEINTVGFKFGRYASLDVVNYISSETIQLLSDFCINGTFKTHTCYNTLIKESLEIQQILRRSGFELHEEKLKEAGITNEEVRDFDFTSIRGLLIYALEEALLTESKCIEPQHIFLAITKINSSIQKLLQKENLNTDVLREVVKYHNFLSNRKAKLLDPDVPYYRKGGIGKAWIYGWTFILGHFSKEINKIIAESRDIFGIGHDEEVESLISTLGKVTNKNALLIGEPGVGKSSIILGLAQKINRGDVPIQLKDKRIIELDINALIAHSQNTGNMEELVIKAMTELAKAGNTILYIDEIQQIIPVKAAESGHSIAGMMLPYILNSQFPIVGSINYADYKKYFYANESLRQSFTNIETKEISAADALTILESKIPSLENNFNCFITFPALVAAVEVAQRYIRDRKLPSSAVQTIEATCSWAQANGINKITAEHVSKAISIQRNINIAQIDQDESNKLMKLEENIKSKVVGQDEAVTAISEALRRARADIRNPNKPIGSFLFIGPTGVGKTYLAKVVGEEYFGSQDTIIRLDMSEYQEVSSINKFLGTSEGDSLLGTTEISLIDRIKRNAHTVVLFDEIEKAHPDILNLFLQIFDEGRLTSTQGETVDFTHAIIICTSNIGSKILLDSLNEPNVMWEEAKERVLLELRQLMKPELLNRFDDIIVFQPHDTSNLSKIAVLELTQLAKRLAEKEITIKWSDQIPMLIANKSNEPGMGARPMKRYIQDNIEGQIAKGIIEQTIKPGEEIEIKESWIK
ncbi:MAG TPA: ATP-dependent Clp protease ATP-binding subunit [Candidatus Dojkabacteria bacterium]|jgi:ATP-dependent Clp protease ATP-binding subunit ClpA|nr:ATP-dependent Clp protease ATP-binding subunit [Candidatus Dojkabacteria bacterium]